MKAISVFLCALCGSLAAADFRIENSTVLTSTGAYHWSQSRPAVIPGKVIVTTQEIEKRGSHGYRDIYLTETTDGATSHQFGTCTTSRIPRMSCRSGLLN